MNKNIIEASEIPDGETIYLKKDMFGWRIVHPIKDEDGRINKVNLFFGGWRNLIGVIIILLFILGFFYIYNHDTAEMQKVVENPCLYCDKQTESIIYPFLNTTNVTIKNVER